MALEPDRRTTLSGLTEPEAKEFNRLFVLSFVVFVAVAVVAHLLAWMWRPWGGSYHTAMAGSTHLAAVTVHLHPVALHAAGSLLAMLG
ncbi:light-harvesting antenna LH1, beta subunit [Lichenicoccus roseus]|uniref:Light-harvesting protein n=1 Tax=Lichenicoccus roseus TaxID=2683649 RepID=A0A5R9JBD0_9PROT|nr:light-harvesting antenna LH1, beta subunit [Lichenicoccus roseus]TLU74053.1 light-harvesting protein [Lichenicoccus roseus]